MKVELISMSRPMDILVNEYAGQGFGVQEVPAYAAAVCTKNTEDLKHIRRSLEVAIKSGHTSVLEHVSMTFRMTGVSRVTLAQLTRHRLASFDVESQRYAGVNGVMVVPETIRKDEELMKEFLELADKADIFYEHCLERGVPCEDARYGSLEAATTTIVMTMNARELLHFLALRECNKAQWEIREMAEKIRDICIYWMPGVFGDSGAPCRRGNCPEARPCRKPKNVGFPTYIPENDDSEGDSHE